MAATAHRRTDDKQLTTAHKKYLQGVTEDKLELAYKLDPSNYTNYGNYHLFIVTTNYGRSAANDDAALKLAHETLVYCKSDQLDPASYVTAASAAYNVIYHIGAKEAYRRSIHRFFHVVFFRVDRRLMLLTLWLLVRRDRCRR